MQDDSGGSSERPKKPLDHQLNRACEACRLSKVRCLMNPDATSSSQCQRCAKANKPCVFAPPVRRRQRKRTDVRVAELEKEVKQMRLLLRSNRISPVEHSEPESNDEDMNELHERKGKESLMADVHLSLPIAEPDASRKSTGTSSTTATTIRGQREGSPWEDAADSSANLSEPYNRLACGPHDTSAASEMDIIDRGLITEELAQELLDIYRNELVDFPGVIISDDWTIAKLRYQKPALFHAVMAAASHCKGAALSNRLHEEVVYIYARSLFIKGEKSLQYIQALLITVTYYTPPSTPAQLQIYQYGNMAASMALELGLAYKPRTHEQLPKRAIRSLQKISSPEELLENCRTILILYTLTAGFAMRLRRPNILSYNSWMEECLCMLQKSPLLNDKKIVAWVQLQRIADEANTAFGFDDASTSFSLSELRLQVILRIFERRMEDWLKAVPKEVMSSYLEIEYHQNMISMWEFGMDGGRYDAPEFRNRHLTLPALDDDCVQPESLLSRSALQINATIKCIGAAHSLLDAFMQVPTEQRQKAPNTLFARSVFALVALMKADYAVGTDAEGMGVVLDSQSLKVDYYLDTILKKTVEAIGPQKCRVPSHWLFVLNQKLKIWHDEHQVWRKEKTLKRGGSGESEATGTPATPFMQNDAHTAPLPTTAPTAVPSEQATDQVPYFGLGKQLVAWPQTGLDLTGTQATQNLVHPQTAFPTAIGDFSEAFQNGDLYLWNDVSMNFGGWEPQNGASYSDLQFGTFNDQHQL